MQSLPSITEASAAIAAGDLDPCELVERCLQNIRRNDDQLHAWVLVDEDGARRAAKQVAQRIQQDKSPGPLAGIPIGVKDIVDVAEMPTRAGSRLRQHHRATEDAPVVAQLRRAGAVVLGKTVTTEFASFDPSPTRNPWHLRHTPGGSSSGSAAAVAAQMCLAALGSQTGGSITRPASYCGIAGLKPTYGAVTLKAVVPLSFHLDHLGVLARWVSDLGILWQILRQCPGSSSGWRPAAQLDQRPSGEEDPLEGRPRLRLLPAMIDSADPPVREVTQAALQTLREAWRSCAPLDLSADLPEVVTMHRRIMAVEAAQYHRQQYGINHGAYGKQLSSLIDEGLSFSAVDYAEALQHQLAFRERLAQLLGERDVAIMASTPTTAPARLDTTGDPRFNSPWSYAGLPTITIPCGLAADEMPCGLQLVAPPHREMLLLQAAAWCERRLNWTFRPALKQS